MRWFKHLSMAHSDHAVSAILEELGAEAYGVWWLIIEDIAASMESKSTQTFAIHSDVKWSQICYCSARKFRSIAIRLQEKGLIVCISTDNRLQIDVPKLLKFRDEYSKKSGQSPDSRSDTDTDTDTEEKQKEEQPVAAAPKVDKSDPFNLPEWIDSEIWSGYLDVRKAKKAAKTPRAWNLVVRELEKFRLEGYDPNEILSTSVRSNWTDVYRPKIPPPPKKAVYREMTEEEASAAWQRDFGVN